jgi:hypothetical protein
MTRRTDWEGLGVEVLTTSDFEGERVKRQGLYAVCFGATWCFPTRRFVPKFLSMQADVPAHLAIADITDLKDPLWDSFRIKITPSVIVFREGEVTVRFDGQRMFGLGNSDLLRVARFLREDVARRGRGHGTEEVGG